MCYRVRKQQQTDRAEGDRLSVCYKGETEGGFIPLKLKETAYVLQKEKKKTQRGFVPWRTEGN